MYEIDAMKKLIVHELDVDPASCTLYAVIDAAQVPMLHIYLDGYNTRFASLFSRDLADDMRDISPYLVEIDTAGDMFEWILSEAASIGACIFLVSGLSFEAIRLHLKKFLKVEGPTGSIWFFRFYVAKTFAAHYTAFTPEQRVLFFAPISRLFSFSSTWDHMKIHTCNFCEHKVMESTRAEV